MDTPAIFFTMLLCYLICAFVDIATTFYELQV